MMLATTVALAAALTLPAVAQTPAAAPATQGGAPSASEFKLNPNDPVDVSSNSTHYDQNACTLLLTGKVQITQKQARLVGDKALAIAAKKGNTCDAYEKFNVDGNVYYVTPDETVRADHGLYDLNLDKVIFTGNVVTVRGQDVGTGAKLTVDLKTNDYDMEGPVHAVIVPPPKGSGTQGSASAATKSAQTPPKSAK
jgi:lipopolysaccharide export system protein LptA